MLMDTGLVALGLALLVAGGDALVRGALMLATRLRLPPLFVGLTIVGFGTSLPELLVSVEAALAGLPDIAVGNVVGSNTANILLILGIAMVLAPMPTRIPGIMRDTVAMLAATAALTGVAFSGGVSPIVGLAFVLALALYLVVCARTSRDQAKIPGTDIPPAPLWRAGVFSGLGLLALVFGADCLVEGARSMAATLGVSDAVIGLSVVAVGTSLPELATSIAAALRRQPEIAIGNVLGSNLFNILGILGLTSLVAPLPFSAAMIRHDIPVMAAATLVLAVLVAATAKLPRLAGVPLLIAYGWYCTSLLTQGVST
jgi:cation:H+ antiporter|uniref:calcium/sodium antiporter n=1 Tax=Stappia sp. TaxID=1870903 RepID=UPI003BA848C7